MRENVSLPDDLIGFLEEGRQLQFDPMKLEMKFVVFKTRNELAVENAYIYPDEESDHEQNPHNSESGRYVVPVISLIKECDYFDPFGLLVWVPSKNAFGTYDTEHDQLFTFPGVTWTNIEENPLPYLNFQWDGEDEVDFIGTVNPWEEYYWYTKGDRDL